MEQKQRSRGRGRGVLALTSYEPCPRPSQATIGHWHQPKPHISQIGKQINKNLISVQCAAPVVKNAVNVNANDNVIVNGCVNTKDIRINGQGDFKNKDIRNTNGMTNVKNNEAIRTETSKEFLKNASSGMIAKYSYKAQPHKPGGFDELTIKQGEKLALIHKGHEETKNYHWWEVKKENGEQGFVPATFCFEIEAAPTSLPWLESKRLVEEKEEKKRQAELAAKPKDAVGFGAPSNGAPKIKEYISSYSNSNTPQARNPAEAAKQYYCEVCDKNLNGPQPYKMHMSSKAHREEMEYQESKNG